MLLDRDAEHVQRALHALRREGVLIELDDFGTGYASLTHLKQYPVNAIKIDRSFVGTSTTDPGSAAIIKAVLQLGESLGMRVTAEGIETAEQAAFLREHGCVFGQGYLFGRPMPAREIPQFIASWSANRKTDA